MPEQQLRRMLTMAETWRAQGDRRCVFAEGYSRMTEAMLEALRARRFEDPAWVRDLLVLFADYYFAAVRSFDATGRAPETWRLALEAAVREDLCVVQHLFLGINAHINRDLVFTLLDMFTRFGEPTDRRRADFDLVNEVIEETVDEVQQTVIGGRSRLWALVDFALGPLDEWLVAELIEGWRDDVWAAAVSCWAAPDTDRPGLHRRVEEGAAHRALTIIRLG